MLLPLPQFSLLDDVMIYYWQTIDRIKTFKLQITSSGLLDFYLVEVNIYIPNIGEKIKTPNVQTYSQSQKSLKISKV
jgi:hypothetical protein